MSDMTLIIGGTFDRAREYARLHFLGYQWSYATRPRDTLGFRPTRVVNLGGADPEVEAAAELQASRAGAPVVRA